MAPLEQAYPVFSEIRDIHGAFVIERPIPAIGSPCPRHFRVNSIALELARSIGPWSYSQRATKRTAEDTIGFRPWHPRLIRVHSTTRRSSIASQSGIGSDAHRTAKPQQAYENCGLS